MRSQANTNSKEVEAHDARAILVDRVGELRAKSYEELRQTYLNRPVGTTVQGPSGRTYEVEVEAWWDDPRKKQGLRVCATVITGRVWGIVPRMLTEDFIVAPHG